MKRTEADLEVQEKNKMQEIIDRINRKIVLETAPNMTSEQEHYISGLADAVQIIKECIEDNPIIGKRYFVIMYHDKEKRNPYVEEMMLYRINYKKKTSYCFTRNLSNKNPTPDLVLSSKEGLALRVFETREKAESRKYLAWK